MGQILLPGDAGFADVLAGKKFSAGQNYIATGTMPDNGAWNATPGAAAIPVPAGKHSGAGQVAAVVVPVANVLAGTTIAGQPGTMPERGSPTITPVAAGVVLAAGHFGGGGIPAEPNFLAANILSGKSMWGLAGTLVQGKKWANGGPVSANASGVGTITGLAFRPKFVSLTGSSATNSYYGWIDTNTYLSSGMNHELIRLSNAGTYSVFSTPVQDTADGFTVNFQTTTEIVTFYYYATE